MTQYHLTRAVRNRSSFCETQHRSKTSELRRGTGDAGWLFRHVDTSSPGQSSRLLGDRQSRSVAPSVIAVIGSAARSGWLFAGHWYYRSAADQWPDQAGREMGDMDAPGI